MTAIVNQKLLIIIPTYNEAVNIPILFDKLHQFCQNANLLFVDDNSDDGTIEKIREHSKNFKIKIIQRAKKMGLGSAYIDGIKFGLKGNYDFFLQMDADLSHDPKYIPQFLAKIQDFDFMIGSRYVKGGGIKGWTWARKFISYGGNLYARIVLGSKINDLTGGFNIWSRKTLEAINLDNRFSEGYVFQIEMKIRAVLLNCKFYELPIIFTNRISGNSKMCKKIVFEAIKNVWKI